ncbi:MAG: hypothetical protein Hens3KO_21040 [Henriciella sp.]
MTRSAFVDLKRFDPAIAAGQASIFDLHQLQVVADNGAMINGFSGQPESASGDDAADEHEQTPEELALAEQQSRLEAARVDHQTAITQLAESILEIDRQAKAETLEQIVQIAESLFPKLGKAFLCEEISNHLPDLLSKQSGPVTLITAPAMTSEIEGMIARHPALAEICTIKSDPALSDLRVQIDWQSGGYDLNFDSLLEVCIGRLQANKAQNKDIHDAADS